MSQPPAPGVPPEFQPPVSYGGYGGALQNYDPRGYPRQVPPESAYPYQTHPENVYQQQHPSGSYLPPGTPAVSQPPPTRPPLAGPAAPQRPAVIGLATTLAATASLQWVCALTFSWLVATAGAAQLGTTGVDGGLFHILNRFDDRMLNGLAWPLYLFPIVSFVLSFTLLSRARWARLAFTGTGVAALVWSGFWLRDDLVWWLAPAGYIAIAVLVLWTAPANQWYRWGVSSPAAGQPHQPLDGLVDH